MPADGRYYGTGNNGYYGTGNNAGVSAYDVTYEYGGRGWSA